MKSNFYADWRLRSGLILVLREDNEPPPERLLQAVWFHQRLRRDRLTTAQGQRLQVLHPGFWNHEAGPDFRDALLQFNDAPPQRCDVEVDLSAGGWTAHGHDRNPNFGNVALHVVWSGDGPGTLPTLPMREFLDAPLSELSVWLGTESAQEFPSALQGRCRIPLSEYSASQLLELLHQASLVRLQGKARQFQARARQAGWEQALWEGIFRALGYKHNSWPMHRLAELLPRLNGPDSRDVLVLQSRLLGVAGLLPSDVSRRQATADLGLRRLWDCWWREAEAFSDCLLPRELWRFAGIRPANHPQRRLGLAAHWLGAGDLVRRLEGWCSSSVEAGQMLPLLHESLHVEQDAYWSWHWTLRSARLPKPQPLIGATRITDLAMNVFLPWLWMRAVEGQRFPMQHELERRYLAWPAAEDNSVLRLARQRLLGTSRHAFARTAAAQQGLLQIVRDFCEHADVLCTQCRFPELLQEWPA